MEVTRKPFTQISQFSEKDVAYATKHPNLRPFYEHEVNLEAFREVIRVKAASEIDRVALVEVLREQYAGLPYPALVSDQVESLLQPNTFTVTTAHQPSLCTGPLYYIHKIASTINLARQLNAYYPEYRFVPVFVTGGEDHDFEEINHFRVFNKTVTWESGESGSVGMMSTSKLSALLDELSEILGNSPNAEEMMRMLREAYTGHEFYGKAALHLTSALFAEYGLVVFGMNHPRLKSIFAPLIEKEVFEQPSKALVNATTEQLVSAGFSGQAHARDINMFYLTPQSRERIVQENGAFRVLNRDLSFDRESLEQEINSHPERFSPNVVMRPIYQELILPNLAYIGGGGEISYWLERKSQFRHFGIPYPMLIRRNSVLWIDKGGSGRLEKLGLSIDDLFGDTEELIKEYVKQNSHNEISLAEEKRSLSDLYASVINKASSIDPTIAKKVAGEQARQLKSLEQIESRLMRAEKQKFDTSLKQIRSLKDKYFPNNGLQERRDNFLSFYLKHGTAFFETLIENLDPLTEGMVIIREI